ncbi:YdeI/OmpD-associated family protein [Leptospira sp. 201903075]|uniref:YdeI/OmpD-associated family protein n=1 Tax=Leptospira chreensis TaxID=2810035 RepID=UPI001962DA31|nr:YdeI/OmpD-associated family protein [Leptospira chreensis]MBM9590838.1 YdeI/OmpD-associated family protein [Leptospira chreensis]
MNKNNEMIIKSFSSATKWKEWLMLNFVTLPDGIWLRIYKKDSGKKTITYDEALDEALCFGWIDSQKKKYDEISWIQKFTPRRPQSNWSKRNREKADLLIKEKRMQPKGLLEIETAKKDGRWDKAYDSPSQMEIPPDFLAEVVKDQDAHEFFKTLNKANLFAIGWRLQTAKTQKTRDKRMKTLLEMIKNQQKLH